VKDLFCLDGKVAIVTGGVGLIGRALAEGIASFGACVYIADINREAAMEFAAELQQRGYQASTVLLDIRDPHSISSCVDKVLSSSGSIDVWVNSAYPKTQRCAQRLEDIPEASWREDIDAHLNGYSFCCREAARAMLASRKGSIINLGSTYGIVGPDFSIYEGLDMTMPATYAAIKGGIINLTRFLASYYGKDGIRVNCISPGGVENQQPEAFIRRYVQKTPLGRMANPQDIVGAAVFLASEASSYVTGHNLVVDGGWTTV
jgi:NAD(P)-dependent dehydrogenase (short-subunit alcohol dehydrogenase family)